MPRRQSQGIIVLLLIGTLALIAYGTLYPFDLKSNAHDVSVWRALGQLSWARSGRADRVANVLLYVPLGFCLLLWFEGKLRRRTAVILSALIGTALSYGIEVTQVFIDQRVSSYWDVVCNSIGGIIGALAGAAWHDLSARLDNAKPQRGNGDKGAILVIALWLAWRLWPFVPRFSFGKFKSAFSPLTDPNFSTAATLHYLVWWTLLAHVVFSIVSERRSVETLLALIAIVLAASLVINAHGFVPSELLALVLLLPTLLIFNRLTPGPRRWISFAAFVVLFIYDSFAPFVFRTQPTHFDLWPFIAWMHSGFPIDWEWLARRACYFAALAWLLKEIGMSARTINFVLPIAAFAIEIVQLWTVGQNGSITEPVLAFAIGWIMRSLAIAPNRATLQPARSR